MSKSKKEIYYKHIKYSKNIEKGKLVEHDENLIDDGEKLAFKVFDKNNGNIEKYIGRKNKDGTFLLTHIINDQKSEENLTLDELISKLKKIKSLSFVLKYIDSQKQQKKKQGGYRTISRKSSRKHSRKSSRGSRKASRKKSRKLRI